MPCRAGPCRRWLSDRSGVGVQGLAQQGDGGGRGCDGGVVRVVCRVLEVFQEGGGGFEGAGVDGEGAQGGQGGGAAGCGGVAGLGEELGDAPAEGPGCGVVVTAPVSRTGPGPWADAENAEKKTGAGAGRAGSSPASGRRRPGPAVPRSSSPGTRRTDPAPRPGPPCTASASLLGCRQVSRAWSSGWARGRWARRCRRELGAGRAEATSTPGARCTVHGAAVRAGLEGDLAFGAAVGVVQARHDGRVLPGAAVVDVQGRPVTSRPAPHLRLGPVLGPPRRDLLGFLDLLTHAVHDASEH
ncbi:hypothetical protein OEIGOIKO_00052 [Streptomyces chrestomyceticus JCM 4735]|uniref:Uncharacterized protein n=1 Tax=Streptomyces chrestomyceticus JCM 4735 TaxID=1306181 RepID=A0A7U9KN67_9ACTN|nr:hypothetical protein OEIGOIKO_00052 [Streptomyces chrestomyceticus JCM 4735]